MGIFELAENPPQTAIIKVIGVGGGGGNAVEHMRQAGMGEVVEIIVANTDVQALNHASGTVLQLGSHITRGLGAGANPEIGRQSALEDKEKIQAALMGADMVFITAGMGGGTGTGAAPVIAEIAKELGALTVAVVTKPFPFEGKKRMQHAEEGINQLAKVVDSLITIPNQKLLSVLGKTVSLLDAFKAANNVLLGAVQGISELITRPGLINVDFADVRTVMSEMGIAMMGTGAARGENRARVAAEAAIASPLLEEVNLAGAKGVLVNITGGLDMSISEFEEVGDAVKQFTSEDATVIVGTVIDPELQDEIRVTLVATGLGKSIPVSPHFEYASRQPNMASMTTTVPSLSPLSASSLSEKHPYLGVEKTESVLKKNKPVPLNRTKKGQEGLGEAYMDYLDIPAFLRRQVEETE